ncbi:MAG: phage head-tail connector protein [Alphaproteobacteria bacterium]|nr:phage head-tail connector protein [Alphaproteobacteria bacterium]
MKLVLIEQPTDEIITLQETKNYLRIDHDFDDDLLKMLIKSTRTAMETIIQKSIMSQTWEYTIDHHSVSNSKYERRDIANVSGGIITIPLPKSPVVNILSVKMGSDTIEITAYCLERVANKFCLILNCKNIPSKKVKYPIVIRYQSGISTETENIPYQLKLANLMLVANAYQERYSYSQNNVISQSVKELLMPFLNLRIF